MQKPSEIAPPQAVKLRAAQLRLSLRARNLGPALVPWASLRPRLMRAHLHVGQLLADAVAYEVRLNTEIAAIDAIIVT